MMPSNPIFSLLLQPEPDRRPSFRFGLTRPFDRFLLFLRWRRKRRTDNSHRFLQTLLCTMRESATASLDRRQITAPRSSHFALGVLLIDVMDFLLLEVEPHVRAQQETLLVHPHLDGRPSQKENS